VQGVEAVKRHSLVPGDWDRALAWLDDALAETWTERGLLPGIGSVLRALGMERGVAFQRAEFADPGLSRTELWEKAVALLDGFRQPEDEPTFYESLKRARSRWRALPEPRQRLLGVLARFELSPDQVTRLSEPRKRQESGVEATEDEIFGNPYVIFEQDHGTADSSRVALDAIDRGVVLDPGRWSGEDPLPPDDISRIRTSAVAVLEEAAESGHTFLPLEELLDNVERRFPERRRCSTDLDVVLGSDEFLGETLHFERDHDPPLVALPRLREAERRIRELVERRWRRENDVDDGGPKWATRIAKQFKEEGSTALAPTSSSARSGRRSMP
jgi:exodeoxyribonuclease V alpha subunit